MRRLKRQHLLGLIVVGVATLGAGGYTLLRTWLPAVQGGMSEVPPDPRFQALDSDLRGQFLDSNRSPSDRYADLFRYFVTGFVVYRSPDGARAHYPGAGSVHGQRTDGLEGYSRIAPLLAAWIASGREPRIDLPNVGTVDLLVLLRDGLATGTDPAAPGYWGEIEPGTQTLFEAADIALSLWLARDRLWPMLDLQVRTNVIRWLARTQHHPRARFLNWTLTPIIVNRVMKVLGAEVSETALADDWAAIRAGYLGRGWFRDGAELDYYNAWAFHYALHWLAQLDPDLDAQFIATARREFAAFVRHLITPRGLPMLGRSICYRTAVPVPLIADALSASATIGPGEALHGLDAVWRYFVEKGAVSAGTLTQGYCGADLRILDRYSGPASCLWGLRSLILALSQPDDAPFWTADMRPLPIEVADYSFVDDVAGWRIEGRHTDLAVTIHRAGQTQTPQLAAMRWYHRLAEYFLERPFRPRNRKAKYHGTVYPSDPPFCGCRE
ncbi:MAG: DUF2264 domain-containing protein [Gammaproteobacteria bacterium]|nr:DUF2264 domain-containing protein [Gammaproteobacteria bacterium]